jgi:hypothetical protein
MAPTVFPEPPPTGRKAMSWTAIQVQAHLQSLEAMMLVTNSIPSINRAMRDRFGLKPARVYVLMARIRDQWFEEDKLARPTTKAAQIRRLKSYIDRAQRGERDAKGRYIVKPDLKVTKELEQLLCRIEGNEAPIEVNVDVRVGQAAQQVIAGMSRDEVQELMQEAREQKLKAAQADRLLAETNRTLVVVPG